LGGSYALCLSGFAKKSVPLKRGGLEKVPGRGFPDEERPYMGYT
jgi:hypothetical protein